MKKWLAGLGLLMLSVAVISHAGTPRENFYMGQAPLANTTIQGSTATTASNANLTVSLPAVSVNSGGTSYSCRTCFTKFFVQIPTTTIISILDAGTTIQTIDGAGLGTTGVNSLSLPEDHLGPMCAAAGDAVTINGVTGGVIGMVNHQVINYEGYTNCGIASTENAGN